MATAHSISASLRTRDATSTRLLESGLRVFGEHGIHGVSTRQLAQAAGVNVAAIPYYFGGKEGYYLAVARHIVDCYAAPMRELVAETRKRVEDAAPDPATHRALLRHTLASFAQLLLSTLEGTQIASFVLREQLQPTEAFEAIYEGVIRPVHEALSLLVGRLTGCDADNPATIIRTHVVLGQVLAFETGRATILRRLRWQEYAPQRIEEIAAIAAECACRALDSSLTAPSADQEKSDGCRGAGA